MQLSVIKASGGEFDELLKCVNESFLVPSFKKDSLFYIWWFKPINLVKQKIQLDILFCKVT